MQDTITPLAFTIPTAVKASGIGRTRMYELIGAGTIEARKAGTRTLVMTDSLRAYLSTLPPAAIRAPRQKAAA